MIARSVLGGGIEASERAGQAQFVESDVLPTEIQDPYGSEKGSGRAVLESWGFVFGEPVKGDPIFMQAKIPPGWSKEGSDHAMWSHIVDETGRQRCAIFYKAAFYDRSAHLSICRRYVAEHECQDEKIRTRGPVRGVVKEGAAILFTGPWREDPPGKEGYGGYDLARSDAAEWLKANRPEGIAEQWAQP